MSEEKDIIKLASCPFCGDDQSSFGGMSEDAFASGSEGSLSVNCNCGALGPSGSTMTNAVAAWNTRTAASEITRLRGEAEALEVEISALVESAREAQQLYVQADNETQRLRGEVERLSRRETDLLAANNRYLMRARDAEVVLGDLLKVASGVGHMAAYPTFQRARDLLSSAPKPEEG